MGINATSASRANRVNRLKIPAAGWEFLWTEYLASRAESHRYHCEAVRPADARFARRISRFPPFLGAAAGSSAMDAERSRLLREAAADYGEIQRRHGALVHETSQLHEALIMTPAPNKTALLWKIEQLLSAGVAGRQGREMLIADARRLLGVTSSERDNPDVG